MPQQVTPSAKASDDWSLKPIGRIQLDAADVSSPDGLEDPGLGFSSELRRARLGFEGTVPGGIGFKVEADFAGDKVELADALLTVRASKTVGFTIGQHNNHQSLEELTSSRFTSFMERAAFTDAFNFSRRLGLSVGYARGDLFGNIGIFTDEIQADDAEDGSVSADARLVYAPRVADAQFHFGGSAHFRDNGEGARPTRYSQRPFANSSDARFIATPVLPVTGETHFGLEAAMIRGPLHAAAEVHWLHARTFAQNDPGFFGGYAEVGYFLTGERRGYRGGRFQRTGPKRPVTDGGPGALQLNLRFDRLDLSDSMVSGGRQNALAASLIWIPHDHVRLTLNYAHLRLAESVLPSAAGDRSYGIRVLGARFQADF